MEGKIVWDQEVTGEIMCSWIQFTSQMMTLNKIKIPRHAILPASKVLELHGYSDASMKAFGAVIYIKSVDTSGNVKVNLLASKSKVAQ